MFLTGFVNNFNYIVILIFSYFILKNLFNKEMKEVRYINSTPPSTSPNIIPKINPNPIEYFLVKIFDTVSNNKDNKVII